MSFTRQAIEKILKEVASRRLSRKKAFEKLRNLPYEAFSFARIDHHRSLRKGFPEAVYAPGKSLAQLQKIIRSICDSGQSVIVTRLEKKVYQALRERIGKLRYAEEARIGFLKEVGAPFTAPDGRKRENRKDVMNHAPAVAVLTGGTSDLPVAEEAAVTLEVTGYRPIRLYDCGVAGLHRLLDGLATLEQAKAIICVAGMEGALASVVAGLTSRPVIAVPTSVGYGASFKGIAPLLTMLNSCAQGVAVVNIDNGFGAACFAAQIVELP